MKFVVQIYKGVDDSKVADFLTGRGISIVKEIRSWGQLINDGEFGMSDREVTMDTFFVCNVDTDNLEQTLKYLKVGLYSMEYRYVPDASPISFGGKLHRKEPGGDFDLLRYDEFFEKPESEGGIVNNPQGVYEYDFMTTRFGRVFRADERARHDRLTRALRQFDEIIKRKITSNDLGLSRTIFASEAAHWADKYFGFTEVGEEAVNGQRRYLDALQTDSALQVALEARVSMGLPPIEGKLSSGKERI